MSFSLTPYAAQPYLNLMAQRPQPALPEPALPSMGVANPVAYALQTLANPLQPPGAEDGGFNQPAPSIPSPDQSLSAMARSVGNALSVASPFGFAGALGALAMQDARGVAPSTLGLGAATRDALSAGLSNLANPISTPQEAMQALAQGVAADYGMSGISTPGGQAAVADMSDAIGMGIGPESPGYGNPSSESQQDSSPSNGDANGDGNAFAAGGLVGLPGGGKVAVGPGSGLDDLIPTTIEGRRAARLSDSEFVIPADVVSMMGDGSSRAGSQRLYDLVREVRKQKTGTARQAGPLEIGQALQRIFRK